MTKPYLSWWFPVFDNPDKDAPLARVSLCTVDNEMHFVFRHPPSGFKNVSDVTQAYNQGDEENRHWHTWSYEHRLTLAGGREGFNTLDTIAGRLEALAKIHPSLDCAWFKKALEKD